MKRRRVSAQASSAPGRVRIVGGRWRGRRLRVPPVAGLRPTPERLRETVFNWLAPSIHGARCLDLFAGSGALGLEALSRGAASAVLVERNRWAWAVLRDNAASLDAEQVEVICADALAYLKNAGGPFDVVFLDPPFDAGLLAPVLAALARGGMLSVNARVYIEQPRTSEPPQLPDGWICLRRSAAGHASGALFMCDAPLSGVEAATIDQSQ